MKEESVRLITEDLVDCHYDWRVLLTRFSLTDWMYPGREDTTGSLAWNQADFYFHQGINESFMEEEEPLKACKNCTWNSDSLWKPRNLPSNPLWSNFNFDIISNLLSVHLTLSLFMTLASSQNIHLANETQMRTSYNIHFKLTIKANFVKIDMMNQSVHINQ